MREIKFRAWDKNRNTMLTPNISGEGFMSINDWFVSSQEPITPWILMQFTGLKDKNGVEIYEGDIISSTLDIRFIEFKDGAFVASKNKPKLSTYLDAYLKNDKGYKVIGNIYENPKLLTNQ